jgi:retron-type reverse transcriptase
MRARVAARSKDEVILEEMIRLGFWEAGGDLHTEELKELEQRRGELHRQLSEIWRDNDRYSNPERALKAIHEERKKAARDKRRQTKLDRARARQERAQRWAQKSRDSVWHLGPGVSAALSSKTDASKTDAPAKPLAPGLPPLADAPAIAAAMGVPVGELRFLAYARPTARVSHYARFSIPKKTGGQRLISAPMPRLKYAQYWLLDAILAHAPLHAAAHGFVPGRSILTNARAHVGRDVVVNLDLKDFFPTIDDRRVKGLFEALGYSEPVAQVLALIATEPVEDEAMIDGKKVWLARAVRRRLPQGAPCSPAITNLLCRKLDRRLAGLAQKLGFTYTRYADDLTFSASGEGAKKVGTLLRAVGDVVAAEGFAVHPDKTRVMRKGARQEVTGLIVNERLGVGRVALRRARAALHCAETKGLSAVRFGAGPHTFASLAGFANFVAMVDEKQGAVLRARVAAIRPKAAATQNMGAPTDKAGAFGAHALRVAAKAGALPEGWRWRPAERPQPAIDPVLAEAAKQAARAAARTGAPTWSPGAPSSVSASVNAPVWGSGASQPPSTPVLTGVSQTRSPGRVWGVTLLVILAFAVAPFFAPAAGVLAFFAWRLWRKL